MKEEEKSLLVRKPDLEKVRHLLSKGVDPNCVSTSRGTRGLTPLINAVNSENMDLVKILLEGGADPNIAFNRNTSQASPLCLATWYSNTKIVKLLLHAGADPNKANCEGWAPLHWAAFGSGTYNWTEIVEMLLGAGANPDKADNLHGRTPLDLARRDGKYGMVKQLLVARAEDSG